MTTIPDHVLDVRLAWASYYIGRGWPVFVLGRDKTPIMMCSECRTANYTHDREACDHLLCHGFYAATLDIRRVAQMIAQHPDGQLAVRTGRPSGLVVLDFEATSDGIEDEDTGLDVLDQWETWVDGGWSLPNTLRARSQRGGLHLYYTYPSGGQRIGQKNRPLPAMDVKADGGYVALPSGDGVRDWVDDIATCGLTPVESEPRFLAWLQTTRGARGSYGQAAGRSGDRPTGYDYERFIADGPPIGVRDEFFNDMIFRLVVSGATRFEIEQRLHPVWQRLDDPQSFPWHDLLYKVDRVLATVKPNEMGITATQVEWARRMATPKHAPQQSESTYTDDNGDIIRRVGRVTIVDRKRRIA